MFQHYLAQTTKRSDKMGDLGKKLEKPLIEIFGAEIAEDVLSLLGYDIRYRPTAELQGIPPGIKNVRYRTTVLKEAKLRSIPAKNDPNGDVKFTVVGPNGTEVEWGTTWGEWDALALEGSKLPKS